MALVLFGDRGCVSSNSVNGRRADPDGTGGYGIQASLGRQTQSAILQLAAALPMHVYRSAHWGLVVGPHATFTVTPTRTGRL